jgi:hypothetical protein
VCLVAACGSVKAGSGRERTRREGKGCVRRRAPRTSAVGQAVRTPARPIFVSARSAPDASLTRRTRLSELTTAADPDVHAILPPLYTDSLPPSCLLLLPFVDRDRCRAYACPGCYAPTRSPGPFNRA